MTIPIIFHHQSDLWEFNHKVVFDGPNKLVLINESVLSIDVKIDLYSDWKEWATQRDHLKYEAAFRSVGGDPTIEGNFLGSTYFLINGWRIRTWEGDHELIVDGNMFVDGGGQAFVNTLGSHTILITSQRSNLVDLVVVSASADTSGSFAEEDRILLQSMSQNIFDIRTAVVMGSGFVIGGTLSAVTTSFTTVSGSFDDMFVALTTNSTSLVRKVESHLSGGVLVFDTDLPFTFPSGSQATMLPGYNPINGRVG